MPPPDIRSAIHAVTRGETSLLDLRDRTQPAVAAFELGLVRPGAGGPQL